MLLAMVVAGWRNKNRTEAIGLRPDTMLQWCYDYMVMAIISVSLAGCAVNILIATAALFLLQFEVFKMNGIFVMVLVIAAKINFTFQVSHIQEQFFNCSLQ